MLGKPFQRRLAAFIAVRLVFTTVEIATAQAGPVGFDRGAGTVVVHYAETLGELAEGDRGPSLTIYGDGVVESHYPAYMRRAGNYRGRLTPQELEALVARLDAYGVLVFEADEIRAERRVERGRRRAVAAATGAPMLFAATDPTTTTIRVEVNGETRVVSWAGLRGDAKRFPGIVALQGLRSAQRELAELMERADLARSD